MEMLRPMSNEEIATIPLADLQKAVLGQVAGLAQSVGDVRGDLAARNYWFRLSSAALDLANRS
jgi:hypothetical protein